MVELQRAALRQDERFTGELVWPDDERFDAARQWRSASVNHHPVVIARCRSEEDVVAALQFARENGLAVAVRSGGHGLSGQSTADGGVLIDLSPMNGIEIDPSERTGRVGAGAVWEEVAAAAGEYGLALSSGDVGTVGVGGLTVGGGIGWFVRKHGLTIDNVISATVVTGEGEIITASETEHPDLFWALRGGGGNFGIVTSFTFRLHPDGMIVGGAIFFDRTEAEDIVSGWSRLVRSAPDELTSMCVLMHLPPAPFVPPEAHFKPVVAVLVCYAGSEEEAGPTVEALRSLGTPLVEMIAPMPYKMLFELTRDASEPGLHHSIRSAFVDDLDDEMVKICVSGAEALESPFTMVQIRGLGGEMSRVPADATAFSHRDKAFMVQAIAAWKGEDPEGQHDRWVEEFLTAMRPHAEGVYVNFLATDGKERAREAYSDSTWRRLEEVKRRYDPENLFRPTVNIQP